MNAQLTFIAIIAVLVIITIYMLYRYCEWMIERHAERENIESVIQKVPIPQQALMRQGFETDFIKYKRVPRPWIADAYKPVKFWFQYQIAKNF